MGEVVGGDDQRNSFFIALKFSGEGDRTTYHTMCEKPV